MDGGPLFWIVLIFGSAIWVLFDAKSLGVKEARPWFWFCATLVLWIIAFPMYLYYRNKFKRLNSTVRNNSIEESNTRTATVNSKIENTVLADLEKLADLREKGIITNQEFEAKKKQLLAI